MNCKMKTSNKDVDGGTEDIVTKEEIVCMNTWGDIVMSIFCKEWGTPKPKTEVGRDFPQV